MGTRLNPDQAVHGLGPAGVGVGDAVHEALQVTRRGAGRAGRAGEPVDAPQHLHAAAGVPGDVPERVQHRVLAARAELEAQIPAALGRVEVVVGEGRHRDQAGRLAGGEPVALVEQGGPDPERDGEAIRDHRGPEQPGIRRRAADADRRRGPARSEEPGPVGDGAQQVGQLSPAIGGHGEREHDRLPLRLGQDARLVTPVERDRWQPALDQARVEDLAGRGGPGRAVGVPGRGARRGAGDGPGDPGAKCPAQERAARRPGRAGARVQIVTRVQVVGAVVAHGLIRHGLVHHGVACRALTLSWVVRCGHHDLRGSVMDAIGASSCRT